MEKLRNLKMVVAYEGTRYAGFQRQINGQTIQGVLEEKLCRIFGIPVAIIGAGRTDAGAHAWGQVVNFKISSEISAVKLEKALNSLLPEDILVRSVEEVSLDFHARYSAKSKTYAYYIDNNRLRPLFNRNFVYHFQRRLDFCRMQQSVQYIIGAHDFKSFQAAGSSAVNTIRTVNFCHLEQTDGLIKMTINADGFLYHMVRNIVGSLLLVGVGKFTVERFKEVLEGKDRSLAGPTAPAQGLCLEEVIY